MLGTARRPQVSTPPHRAHIVPKENTVPKTMQHLFDFTGSSHSQPPEIRHRIMGLVVEAGWNPSAVAEIHADDYDPCTRTLTIRVIIPEHGWAPTVEYFIEKGRIMPAEMDGEDERSIEHEIRLNPEWVAVPEGTVAA